MVIKNIIGYLNNNSFSRVMGQKSETSYMRV